MTQLSPPYDREYLTKEEAASIVGLHPKTIERAVLSGDLAAFKPANRIRIRRVDLDAWVRATAVTPTIHDI